MGRGTGPPSTPIVCSTDVLEHDRILADQRLSKFRASADSELSRQRSGSPARQSSVSRERDRADDEKRAERSVTDSVLDQERQRADAVVVAARRKHLAETARTDEHRRDTDDHLAMERGGADVAVTALVDEGKDRLMEALGEQARGEDVLRVVAHDLRSPLSIIRMNAQCIAEDTDGGTREAAEEVTRAASRMDRLIHDLLDVARIQSGTLRLVKLPHDLGALLTEVLHSYGPLFADRDLTFAVDVPVVAVTVSFDHDRIVQVLSNLLSNTLKFTPPKGTVRLHVEQRGADIVFALTDSGPGIHPAQLRQVFDLFSQIDSDRRRGLGLGLHICEKIIEAHGGRIWVESVLGSGTTFRFTLPASSSD